MSRTIPTVFLLLVILLLGTSCGKDDLLKEPSPVQIRFALNSTGAGGSDRLALTSAYIVLSEIEVEGVRQEGEDFSFRRDFPTGLRLDFGATGLVEDLLFDLPQGDYEYLSIRFKTWENGQDPSWMVQGDYRYQQPGQGNALVDIVWKNSKTFERNITNTQGQQQFTLGTEAETVTFSIQPKLWFKDISEVKLEQALCTNQPRGLVMLIDQTNNDNMFQVLDLELGTTLKASL